MVEEDTKFIDAEAYQGRGEEKITFRMIVLEYLRKIGTFAAVEFRGGYWEEKMSTDPRVNIATRIYIPDTREVYSNAVEFLHDLLYPFFDQKMMDESRKAEKMMNLAFKSSTVAVEPSREEEEYVDSSEEEEYVEGSELDRRFNSDMDRVSFRCNRQEINRLLLRALSCFLNRNKYMEGKSFEEVV